MFTIIQRLSLLKFLPLVFAVLLSGCNNDEDIFKAQNKGDNTLYATIDNDYFEGTRAILDSDDGWSVASFSNNDVIGLYAKTGNGDGGGFTNAPMMYSRTVGSTFQFDNPDLNMDRSELRFNTTMFYYPYTSAMESEGMVLRSSKDGVERCIDVLMLKNLTEKDLTDKLQLSGPFHHIFSELIIMRGEGFDRVADDKKGITVVLNGGYTRLRFIDNPATNGTEVRNMWKVPELFFDENDGLDQEDSRRWEAWEGEPFRPYEGLDKKEAYYVILPNIYEYRIPGGQNILVPHTAVDYIEIFDNQGVLQRISSFTLDGETKQIMNGWRYPLEIKMEGLVPTIYPFSISPWDDTENVTDERTIGIKDESEFLEWLMAYNQYTSENKTGDFDDVFSKYGVKHINETTQEVTWHFYILDNLNFSGKKNVRISKLTDVIDGLGNQLSNISIEDSFIEEISGKGLLSNLTFRGLTINNTTKSGLTNGIGAIANLLADDGSIINCDVDATLKANCKVGMMAGAVTGGTVDGCIFSGLLIGRGSSSNPYRYLIGLDATTGSFSLTDTEFSGIIYSQIN